MNICEWFLLIFLATPEKYSKTRKEDKELTDCIHFSVCLVKPIGCHCQVADQGGMFGSFVVLIVLTHPDHSVTSLRALSRVT